MLVQKHFRKFANHLVRTPNSVENRYTWARGVFSLLNPQDVRTSLFNHSLRMHSHHRCDSIKETVFIEAELGARI